MLFEKIVNFTFILLHLSLEYIHATNIKQSEITTKANNIPNYLQITIKLIIH